MIVETYCDTCGLEYDWPGVTVGGNVYCCAGCAQGGPCTCLRQSGTVVVSGNTTVVSGAGTVVSGRGTVIAGDDDVVVVT